MSDRDPSPLFLVVGKLGRPHGIQGDIYFSVITDFPERLKPGVTLFVGEDHQPLRLQRVRDRNQGGLLVAFRGYETPEAVGAFTNLYAYIRGENLPALAEGEYYHHQLLGLRVLDDEGNILGELRSIIENPANDIYVVQPPKGGEILLPAIEDVILDINLEKGEMLVHLLPGLLPD